MMDSEPESQLMIFCIGHLCPENCMAKKRGYLGILL